MIVPLFVFRKMDIIKDAFEQGLIPGIVIVIYLIINKIIDAKKRDPLKDIAKLLTIVTKDIIDKDREKSKNFVKVAMTDGASEYIRFVTTTIINNNIEENKEQISYNAKHLISSVYYNTYSKLNLYRGDYQYLSHYMKDEWKEDVYNDIMSIIYNKNIDKQKRILAFSDRINIRISDYSSYIINTAFK